VHAFEAVVFTLDDFEDSNPLDVNDSGMIVGYGKLHNGDERPFLIPRLGEGPSSGLFGHPKTPADLD